VSWHNNPDTPPYVRYEVFTVTLRRFTSSGTWSCHVESNSKHFGWSKFKKKSSCTAQLWGWPYDTSKCQNYWPSNAVSCARTSESSTFLYLRQVNKMLTVFIVPLNFLMASSFWIISQAGHSWEVSQWDQRVLAASSDSSTSSIPRHREHLCKVNFATRFARIIMIDCDLIYIRLIM
jgi:hypothetical protein